MERIAFVLFVFFLTSVSFTDLSRAESIPNAPHNEDNSISCANCHTDPLPAKNRSDICITCHDGVSAPLALPHSNLIINGSLGWSTSCLDCHDPHFHYQLVHFTDPDFYLATATIDTGSIVDNGNNTSILSYSSATVKDGWNPPPHADNADWGAKTNAGRGLILVADKDNPKATFEVVSATSSQITVNGVMSSSLAGNTFGIIYGQLVKSSIDTDGDGAAETLVRFFNNSGANSFADDTIAPHDGICQVCHTQTDHFRADGTVNMNPGVNMDHAAGSNCADCHTHKSGFSLNGGSSCASCHPDWGAHPTHTEAAYGPQLACYVCHDTANYPLLADGQDLANTTVCDTCHSAGGSYNGVDSSGDSIGARDNWVAGIYDGGMDIQAGKERWCVGCHDDVPSVIQGVSAPNVAGDNVDYGYYQTGHGKHGNELAIGCLACHDASMIHTDGEARTYTAAADNYQTGYRLKNINGQAPLDIPRPQSTSADQFRLCLSCHDSDPFLNMSSTSTNFRKDVNDDCVTPPSANLINKHWFHLDSAGSFNNAWDSDWDGTIGDSYPSCPTCHNVHGSQTKAGATNAPAMIRTGELIGRASALNLQYFENPCNDQTLSTTNETADSRGGALTGGGDRYISGNGVCNMCHTVYSPYWRSPVGVSGCENCHGHDEGYEYETGKYSLGKGSSQTHSTHTENDSDDLFGPHIDCVDCHDTSNFPYFKSGSGGDGAPWDLSETDVCDNCHSPGGDVDGVNHASVGAKNNWDNGVYNGDSLAAGKELWCISCHDEIPANSKPDGSGISAPNKAGDGVTYGYYINGHGTTNTYNATLHDQDGPGYNCLVCHVKVGGHIDHVVGDTRLQTIPDDGLDYTSDVSEVCLDCHLVGQSSNGALGYDATAEATVHSGAVSGNYNTNAATVFPSYGDSGDYVANPGYQCEDCHEVHGTTKLAMVLETIDGNVGGASNPVPITGFEASDTDLTDLDPSATADDGVCDACHASGNDLHPDTNHPNNHNWGNNDSSCLACHSHTNSFTHSGMGGGGDGTACSTAPGCHQDQGSHPDHLGGDFPGIDCLSCHLENNFPLFADGQDLANTTVCSTCHNDGASGLPNDTGYIAGWEDENYNLGCDGCHGGRPNTTDTLVMSTNGHARLVGEEWIRQYLCTYCHTDTVDDSWNMTAMHTNASVDVAIADQWKIVGQAAPSYDPVAKVCSNTYCHSDGTAVSPEMRDYPWNGGHNDCNACHGHDQTQAECDNCHSDGRTWSAEERWLSAMPMYASTGVGTDRANSHFRHLFTGFSCEDCHFTTVDGGACRSCHDESVPEGTMAEPAHVNGAFHVNKTKTVVFKDGGTYNDTTKTCSNTACHSGTDPIWGGSVADSITCLECHGTTETDVDDFGVFNSLQARINLTQWAETGHGRPTASGNYDSGNPPASLPGVGCWYCHDNQVLHQDDDNPFRLRKHDQFSNRFQKECVYCHMVGTDGECLACHDNSESLAPQLSSITGGEEINPPYTIPEPDHSGFAGGCGVADCHENDATRHNSEAGLWTQDQKDDVENSYVMMGVCLKCHDDDRAGECNTCHTAPADDPETPDVDESMKYSLGFDPGLPGTTFIKPQQAKASSFHFGYKHYSDYEDSIATSLDSGWVSIDAASVTELTDTSKSWTVDEWAGKSVLMTSGVSKDEMRKIKSNTATALSLEKGFSNAVLTAETYEILDPVWKGGKFCWDCHDPHGDGNIYMIQNKVATRTDGIYGRPVTRSDVVFTRKQSGLDYARTSEPFNGICNVCHTEGSQHYAADRGDGHNAGRICTSCHEHRFTDSHASDQACNTCHQNKPVPRHSAFGLPRDCTKCHQGAVGKRMDIMGQFAANSHHVQQTDGTVTNQNCYACHWEATVEGLINNDYHDGYNTKTHASTKNGEVDLVIWNGEESPAVDEEPYVGSRPTVYDLDGSDPQGPGVPTATTFLASNITITAGPPEVTLADQRAEVDKVTLHCVGCHSDQNNNSEPFGDCKTPRQYSWDGSSIKARYGDTGTTTWGKYTTMANTAKKEIVKAFSAHGNAVAGGGGWSTAEGIDGDIPNTRAGMYNVQCFDCHSSHGSKATGTTSSYVTFNGTRNGANLKETQAGKGGYTMTYKASANPDPNSVNPYNAGAGQCFDCHETATDGTTPWGYQSTFGATAPIIGYKDNPHFSGTYPGKTESGPLDAAYPTESNVDLSYRQSRSTLGGHLNASSDLTNSAQGTIDGLCTPCHDPHGVSPSLGDDMAYSVPLLKGTWLTSPFKEDTPPPNVYGTRADIANNRWGRYRSHPMAGTPVANYHIDRNTFDDPVDNATRINEDEQQFAGLCLRCHPQENLQNPDPDDRTFRSLGRIHESVKGWGPNTEHSYPCSKCHQPHASGLPRLMKTNCLNFNHRGGLASGGQPDYNRYGSEYRGFPINNIFGNSAVHPYNTECHAKVEPGDQPGSDWKDKQLWNNVSPW